MYQLTISFENEHELLEKISQIVIGLNDKKKSSATKTKVKKESTVHTSVENVELPNATPAPGEQLAVPLINTPVDKKTETVDKHEIKNALTALQALQKLNEAKGITVAREVLAKFNCQKLSEIKEEDTNAFVEACITAAAK